MASFSLIYLRYLTILCLVIVKNKLTSVFMRLSSIDDERETNGALSQSASSNHALLITKSALVIKKICPLSQPISIQ